MNRILFVSVILAGGAARAIAAQSAQTVPGAHPPAIGFTLGPSTSLGGHYHNREGIAGEFAFTLDHESSRFVEATAGAQGAPGLPDQRCVPPPPGGQYSGGCTKTGPVIAHAGLLFGLERRSPGTVVRAMAGPVYFSGGDPMFGGQFQVDRATEVATHLAIVLAARGGVVARSGDVLGLLSMNVGLRMQ